MKPYLLFVHERYYPSGWEDDFKGSFESQKDALVEANRLTEEQDKWYEIIDLTNEEVIHHRWGEE